MTEELTYQLFHNVLGKMDKAESKDVFYLSMAIGRGLKNKKFTIEQVPRYSDVCYNLYLACTKMLYEYDLQ